MFRESLLPYNNTKTLTKSFEKTSAKGGKPLIKTHDKRFLIKEIKKEEKEFFISLLPKYHHHLKKHPNSLLAKIVGVYSIKIADKDKVYHVLMESLDPVDESFIRFKYDLKFSTVNRREYKSRQEVKMVRDELLEENPILEELFPKQKDLTSLHEIEKTKGTGGMSISDENKSLQSKTLSKSKKTKSNENKTKSSGSHEDDSDDDSE